MTSGPVPARHALRTACIALLVVPPCAGAEVTAPMLSAQAAAELRACVRIVEAGNPEDRLGLRRVDLPRVCPAVAARFAAPPLPGMRGRGPAEDGTVMLRQLVDLMRLAEATADPQRYAGQLSSVRLGIIIDALDPAARGELSTRARVARWWRAMVGDFDPTARSQRSERRRIAWPLGFWSTVSWVSFAIAALLVLTVLVQEIRAALALRMRGRRAVTYAPRRRDPPADLAAIDALPPRERAGALLRAVAQRLHLRGALARPEPLTPREVLRAARLPTEEIDGLRLIAAVGEAGAYGRDEPAVAKLAAARAVAARWLERGDGLGRLRAWRRSVAPPDPARRTARQDDAGGAA